MKIISEMWWLKAINKCRGSMFELGGAPITNHYICNE